MSEYNLECFLADFAGRTIANLEIIESMASHNHFINESYRAYEVTQLINSFLGLVLMPNEKYKKWGNNKRTQDMRVIEEKIQAILDTCQKEHRYFNNYNDKDSGRVFEVINHIRNSIAHSGEIGIHFYPVAEGRDDSITHVFLYDSNYYTARNRNKHNGSQKYSEFCLKLTIEEVRQLIKNISELYKLVEKREGRDANYETAISLMDDLLKQQNRKGDLTIAEKLKEKTM